MKNMKKISVFVIALLVVSLIAFSAMPVFAADKIVEPAEASDTAPVSTDAAAETASDPTVGKALAAAAVVGFVATAGAIGMALAISKSTEGMARQPEAAGKINSAMMLGLVFIETVIIYALIVAILIIFVL